MGYILSKAEFKYYLNKYYREYTKEKLDKNYYTAIEAKKLTTKLIESVLKWKLSSSIRYPINKLIIKKAKYVINDINKFKRGKIKDTKFEKILDKITKGIVIRVFIKHICKPEEYAIYDKWMYRAFIMDAERVLLDSKKVVAKAEDYNQFNKWFSKKCKAHPTYTPKEVDGAYMMWGKYLDTKKEFKSSHNID